MKNQAYIALGSNMGDRLSYLKKAIEQICSHQEMKLEDFSSIYETDPVGFEEQDPFLNMVIRVSTGLTPSELLEECQEIEAILGRKREIKWGPRTIDLDILLYNQENIKTKKLIVPHPRMQERAFVMIPLLELNPEGKDLPEMENDWLEDPSDKKGVRTWKRKNGEDVFALFEN